jgi:hypothetical protein
MRWLQHHRLQQQQRWRMQTARLALQQQHCIQVDGTQQTKVALMKYQHMQQQGKALEQLQHQRLRLAAVGVSRLMQDVQVAQP